MSQQYRVPSTPRVISPSPTPSELGENVTSYLAPVTRSAARRGTSSRAIIEEVDSGSDLELRSRSRSSSQSLWRRTNAAALPNNKSSIRQNQAVKPIGLNGASNGHLSPPLTSTSYSRDLSRSPSPRLIPIHRSWRSFIHRHEIPRKFLHVSIGFFTLHFYASGLQPANIHPWLLGAFIPIASVDILRHHFTSFNRVYVRGLGAFMRESEVNEKYNGVIFYLLGTWISMRFFPKDIGVMSILLLSWCDTAASTFGRLYGRYTPQIRKGKSLAGSTAAVLTGFMTSILFWGLFVPSYFGYEDSFAYKGYLGLPEISYGFLQLNSNALPRVSGWAALGIMSLWSGLVASASELVDILGIDDNLTIPVLSGLGLWGFAKAFG